MRCCGSSSTHLKPTRTEHRRCPSPLRGQYLHRALLLHPRGPEGHPRPFGAGSSTTRCCEAHPGSAPHRRDPDRAARRQPPQTLGVWKRSRECPRWCVRQCWGHVLLKRVGCPGGGSAAFLALLHTAGTRCVAATDGCHTNQDEHRAQATTRGAAVVARTHQPPRPQGVGSFALRRSNPHGANPLNPRGCARASVQPPQPQEVCLKPRPPWLNPHGANPLRHSGVQTCTRAPGSVVRVGGSAVGGAQTAGVFARGGDTHLWNTSVVLGGGPSPYLALNCQSCTGLLIRQVRCGHSTMRQPRPDQSE